MLGLVLARPALAGPSVLIFGGGVEPASNPESIQQHVNATNRAMSSRLTVVLFADGDASSRTVQESRPQSEVEAWLARIFGDEVGLAVTYHAPHLFAPSFRPARLSEFYTALDAAQGDRLGTVVVGAGHGAPADEESPSRLALWGRDAIELPALALRLDRRKRAGPLAMVLGQCHSGAFLELMYRGADPAEPLARPTRCVLAAVPADRQASGCTPDPEDEEARAYLAMIGTALGLPNEADYDHDGAVSLDEAHAFATIKDPTINVPVKTTEAWLQRVEQSLGGPSLPVFGAHELESAALPADAAVLRALGLGLDATDPIAAAHARLDEHAHTAAQQQELADRLHARRTELLDAARERAIQQFPELSAISSPAARTILLEEGAAVIRAATAQGLGTAVLAVERPLRAAETELRATRVEHARLERFLRVAETVRARARLARSARGANKLDPAVDGLRRLDACEHLIPY